MKTQVKLLLISLLLCISQGCIKELHEIPPRPDISIKLNGMEKDTLIVQPNESVRVEVEFQARQGVLREAYIKDQAGAYLPGFPLTLDSAGLQEKATYHYAFTANDYIPDGGKTYQKYSFQLVCQDNNQPKQLINKSICILFAEELNNYTVTLGAQENQEHGSFLRLSSGEVFTLEQVRQMSIEELRGIDLCYFFGDEKDGVSSYYLNQGLYPLVDNSLSYASWYYLTTEYESLAPYAIPQLEQVRKEGSNEAQIKFPQFTANISNQPFEYYRWTTDLLGYRNPNVSNYNLPYLYGIYVFSGKRYVNWPADPETQEYKPSVIRVRKLVNGTTGYIVLDVKASPKYNF